MEGVETCVAFCILGSLLFALPHHVHTLNLDLANFTEFSGPEGSYFGFSADFYQFNNNNISVVVGAPKANTNQPGVTEGGSVFLCPWSLAGGSCKSLGFDQKGDEEHFFNNLRFKASKSHQWFGATVRSTENYILACAPLFHWNVISSWNESMDTPVGNCQVLNMLTGELSNFAPCKDLRVEHDYKNAKFYGDRRYCEAGFSSEFTKDGRVLLGAPGGYFFQGQIITASLPNIITSAKALIPVTHVTGSTMSSETYDHYDLYRGYSVATGEFTGDSIPDYVVGAPNDRSTTGSVKIYKESAYNLQAIKIFYGTQVTSYFGHSLAVTDINNDGRDDILISAPLFMERLSTQQLQEVGQVYVYLQKQGSAFSPRPDQTLTGTQVYGRFGTALAMLGDLNMDGFNDVAVGAPGANGEGCVYIFMGQGEGLALQYAQVLESPFQPLGPPAAFGFTLRGGTDIDSNGYPDLIVGAWGVSKVAIYRAQAVVRVKAQLSLLPDFLNPDVKPCELHNTNKHASCFTVMMCISVSGHRIPQEIVLDTELQLDKNKQTMARRTLLLESNQPYANFQLTVQSDIGVGCKNLTAYLRPESEFKDKLSPIFISVNYNLITSQGVLHGQRGAVAQTRIILDCGEDNVCIPDLKLTAIADTERLLIGDDNPALLIIEAENQGDGAYETELQIRPPANTHYQGVLSDREGYSRLVCAQKKENGTVIVVCDLGNPMKKGQQLQAGLFFSVGRLEEVESHVSFQLQIKSKNSQNPDSDLVHLRINVSAMATLEMRGGSSPDECVLPIANWEHKEHLETLEEVGPLVEHVYELRNLGPSTVNARVEVAFPTRQHGSLLLYVFASASEDGLNCHTNSSDIDVLRLVKPDDPGNATILPIHHINKRHVEQQEQPEQQHKDTIHVNCSSGEPGCIRFVCEASGLERGASAVVKVMARLWVQTFLENPYQDYTLHSTAWYEVVDMPSKIQPEVLPSGHGETETRVVWRSPDGEKEVPVWWIVVSVISGLILLALLSFIFWKVGFFKRNRPPCDDDDDTQELNAGQSEYAEMPPNAKT